MRLWHSLTPGARLILILNSALVVILIVVSFHLISPTSKTTDPTQYSSAKLIQSLMSRRSLAAMSLWDAELETVERDATFVADAASHIFSHPQSFRLAAQPGEYDYDAASGLYGSVRNDGSSILLLSSGTPLNPEILHDIRLSEYLNPVFKGIMSSKPHYVEISLYTTDSLLRSYPWFDVRQKLAATVLKKDFKSAEFVFFDRTRPEKNPLKKPVWTLGVDRGDEKQARALCSAPFESNAGFKGIVAITLNLNKVAAKSLAAIEPQGEISLFLNRENQVVSVDGVADSALTPQIQRVIQSLPKEGGSHFEQLDDFYVQSSPSKVIPLKCVSLLRDVQAIELGLTSPVPVTSQTRPWIVSGITTSLLLLLLNSFWVVRSQQGLESSRQQLSKSFSALADLKLDAALVQRPGDLFERFDSAVQALKEHLELLTTEKKQEIPEVVHSTDAFRELSADATADLDTISAKCKVLHCFDASEPIQACLSKLVKFLAETSQAQRVWFMFYSPAERLLRSSVTGQGVPNETLEKLTIGLSEGGLFERVLSSPQIFWTNSISEKPTESDVINTLISRNILICPLVDQQKIFALLILGDKTGDFNQQDQNCFAALQEPISSVIKDLVQCEGYRKIDVLRREYCVELTKAIEAPLNRIRGEVQSVYSRLGRLTPYYKHHCETILFEVGRLYEIAREASEMELDSGRAVEDRS
jgi:hypothetical protein